MYAWTKSSLIKGAEKKNQVEVLDMGICNGEATLSVVSPHQHQDNKLLILLRHKAILSDVFQNVWNGQSLDFFFKLIFSHQLWTFFTLSVPSYPFPENRKNWGEMSPLYVVLTHVHLQDLPAFIDLLLTKLKLKTPLTVPSPRRWVMPRKEAPSHWRQPL